MIGVVQKARGVASDRRGAWLRNGYRLYCDSRGLALGEEDVLWLLLLFDDVSSAAVSVVQQKLPLAGRRAGHGAAETHSQLRTALSAANVRRMYCIMY